MANEAFALSPMSARAAEPNEQDYDAISEAFMETARGRWFLGEFAKRNRNADTRMVLDAVAKIEETLAAQRQPVVEDRLPEALVEIRRAIREAETVAIAAFDPGAIEQGITPIQRGVRIIKEISWRWREIGADGRICDLIDSQLAAIESACGQVSTIDPRAELTAAFDLLKDRIEQTETGAAAPKTEARPQPAQDAPSPVAGVPEAAPVATEAPVVFTEPAVAPGGAEAIEPEIAGSDLAAEASYAGADDGVAEPAIAESSEEFALEAAAAEAEDEAVLDAIALEMAAPDPDFDEILEPVEMTAGLDELVAAQTGAPVAEKSAPVAVAPAVTPRLAPRAETPRAPIGTDPIAGLTDAIAAAAAQAVENRAPEAAPAARLPVGPSLAEASLGATILASGIVQKPRVAANDALAPIRRMTQAEKIAFFS
ncbi:hypothetical protein JQ543_03500 [Bradyrhizobium diazoefficiens]|nr:hypothetical protein [Bradyrhizobium diazoefficiens]MBR0846799.1 hypothetical protein [Bradyrhizobium diazoefficiens]